MKQLQPSTMCDHRRPYVLMRQAPTDRPPFTQKTDRPVRGYTSHEMHPPRCDRQPRRQAAGLALAQADVPNPALRLRWGQPVQARWPIRLVVPVQKHILLLHHLTEGAKVLAFPELLRPHACHGFVRADRLPQCAGLEIDCVKDKHLRAAFQIACNPITSLPDGLRWPSRFRIVALWRFLDHWLYHTSGMQPAFDGRQRWHLLEQMVVEDLLLEGPCADQADLALLQGAPHGQHNRVSLLGVGLRRMHGSTRTLVQTLPAQSGKAQPPFAQPLAFAREACEYLARTPAFEAQPNCLAAPIQFIVMICHSASFGDTMAATTPCPRCREPWGN